MSSDGPVPFDLLLAALHDSLVGARAAARRYAPTSRTHISQLTVSFQCVIREQSGGLCLHLQPPRTWKPQPLQHIEIRLHGSEPLVTEVLIGGELLRHSTNPPHL